MPFTPTWNFNVLPQRQLFAGRNVLSFTSLVAAAGTGYIGGNLTGDWLHVEWPWLTWDIYPPVNFSLRIETSLDDVTYRDWRLFSLYASVNNRMENLRVPGWKCRLRLENSNTVAPQTVDSIIIWRAVP